jgi:hypothetical protein
MATSTALMKIPGAIETKKNHHATLDLIPNKTGNEVVITTVRNHWDAVVSWWLLNNAPKPLHEFVKYYNHSHYARGNKLWWIHPTADYFMRYEHLQDELSDVLRFCGLPEVTLPIINVTPNKTHWRDYYNPTSYKAVWDRFGDEIDFYGYQDAAEKDTTASRT